MSEEAKWYVIHTYSGYENKVAKTIEKTVANHNLQDRIQGLKIPMETVTERTEKDGVIEDRQVERKVFPGYVLVKMVMDDDSWHVVRNIRGVTSFVGPGSKPVPLTDEEVRRLDIERTVVKIDYGVGDYVRIVDGMLEGCLGTVESISVDDNVASVRLTMFGREQVMDFALDQLEIDA